MILCVKLAAMNINALTLSTDTHQNFFFSISRFLTATKNGQNDSQNQNAFNRTRPIRSRKMATPGMPHPLHNPPEEIAGRTTTGSGRQHRPENSQPDPG